MLRVIKDFMGYWFARFWDDTDLLEFKLTEVAMLYLLVGYLE